jgi:CBS domain-containing protein
VNTAAAVGGEKTVEDVMSTDLIALNVEDTLRLADDLMNLARLRHFPVMDGDRIVGVIDESDLLHASMLSLIRHPKDSPRAALGEVKVRDVMKAATTVAADCSIYDAAQLMVERGIDCLLVLKGEKLVGVVTRTDLLRKLAKL